MLELGWAYTAMFIVLEIRFPYYDLRGVTLVLL